MGRAVTVEKTFAYAASAAALFLAGSALSEGWPGKRPVLVEVEDSPSPMEYRQDDFMEIMASRFSQNGRRVVEYIFGRSEMILVNVYDEEGIQRAPGFFRWCEDGELQTDWEAATKVSIAEGISFEELANPPHACDDGILTIGDFAR